MPVEIDSGGLVISTPCWPGGSSVSSPHSRFLPAALVEDKVVQQWRVERMSEPQARLIRDNLLVDLVEYAKASSTAAIRLDHRIDAIRRERRKWAEKAIKGSIPDDIAREKKQELSGPLIADESAGAKLTITSDQHETAIRSTTALLPPRGEAYRRGNEQLRREYNQAWFDEIRFSTKEGQPTGIR
jgi:hypothetical protein